MANPVDKSHLKVAEALRIALLDILDKVWSEPLARDYLYRIVLKGGLTEEEKAEFHEVLNVGT